LLTGRFAYKIYGMMLEKLEKEFGVSRTVISKKLKKLISKLRGSVKSRASQLFVVKY